MTWQDDNKAWEELSYSEKNIQLYIKQKALLEMLYERNAISKDELLQSLCVLNERQLDKQSKSTEDLY